MSQIRTTYGNGIGGRTNEELSAIEKDDKKAKEGKSNSSDSIKRDDEHPIDGYGPEESNKHEEHHRRVHSEPLPVALGTDEMDPKSAPPPASPQSVAKQKSKSESVVDIHNENNIYHEGGRRSHSRVNNEDQNAAAIKTIAAAVNGVMGKHGNGDVKNAATVATAITQIADANTQAATTASKRPSTDVSCLWKCLACFFRPCLPNTASVAPIPHQRSNAYRPGNNQNS